MLLSLHPHIEARLREEYQQVLSGRAVQMEDLPRLPLTRMVLEESMRLYPPAWAFARQAIDEDEIGGSTIPKGAYVLMFPSTTHRHPDFWLGEVRASVSAINLPSLRRSSSWQRSCPAISSASSPELA
jgi:cytochrome P450